MTKKCRQIAKVAQLKKSSASVQTAKQLPDAIERNSTLVVGNSYGAKLGR
jgi:hypothetical protein